MKKKITSIILSVGMLLSYAVVVHAENRVFTDVPQSHWAYDVISELTSEGVIDGMGDGTFAPEGLVTREQFMKLLVCALDCDTDSAPETELSDVSGSNWSEQYIYAGIERGIYDIDESGDYFNPTGELKRGISAEWIVDGLGVTAEADNVFSDVPSYGKQSEAIASAAKIGIIAGYEDNTFRTENTITRAEAAALIKRVMDYQADLYGLRDDAKNEIELQDDVAVAESSKSVNIPTSVDARNKTIIFSKADETLTDLTEGDILFIPPCDNMPNGFVGKVMSVNGSRSNTKIKFEEPELAEVVQSVDISTYVSAGIDNYANDGELTAVSAVKGVSSKENGMEFDGSASAYMTPDITWHGVKIHAGADADEKAMVHFETESYKEKSGLYAAVDMNMEAKIDIQLETDNFDITKFDASADLITDVSAVGGYNNSVSKEYTYDLPTCTIPLSGIFNVNIYSKLVVKADGSLNIEATADFDNNMGAKFTIDDGFTTHNTTNANAEITVDAEGSLKIGPKEELKLTFCGIDVMGKKFFDGISLIEADAEFGIGATGKTLIDKKASLSDDKISFGDDGELKHLCYFCIEGDIIRYFDGNIGVGEDVQNLINKICDKELSYEFADSEDKISDWHLSTGDGYTLEFELCKCPHYEMAEQEEEKETNMDIESIVSEYTKILNEYEKQKKWIYDSYFYPRYYIYDIDKDGVPELIIDENKSEAEKQIYVYTYDLTNKESKYLGSEGSGHSSLCSVPNENGIMRHIAHMDYEYIDIISIVNDELAINNIISGKNCRIGDSTEYDEPDNIIAGSEYLDYDDVNSLILLYEYFEIDTEIPTDLSGDADEISADTDDIIDAYYGLIVSANKEYPYSVYSLYDIDKDGIVELIIDDGLSNNVRKATFYTYNNGLCYMGDMQLSSTTLCEYPDGNGFAVFWAAKNYESLSREQYINGEFVSSVLGEGRSVSSADEYRNPEDIYPGAYGLKTCSTDSDELLKSVLW